MASENGLVVGRTSELLSRLPPSAGIAVSAPRHDIRSISTWVPILLVVAGGGSWYAGWQATYPLALSSVTDSYWSHISPWIWISIGAQTLALVAVVALRSRPVVAAVVTMGFVLAFSAGMFLHYISGSDTPGVIALTTHWLQTGQLDASVHPYYQWPVTFIALGALSTLTGLTVVVAAHVAFTAIAAGTALALFQLFGRDSWAAGATGLFFVASTTFLDWQMCPQTIAFLLLVVLLSTTRSRRLPAVVGSVVLFTLLSLTHPFAAFWLIGAIILARVTAFLGSHSGRFDVGGWSISPALLIAIELSVVAYIAVSLVRSLADALGAIGHALESGGSISAAAAVASIGSGDGPLMYKLVVWTGVLGVLGAGLTLLAGSLARFVAGRTRPIEVGLGVLGLGQFVIGLVVPVFGGRGVQIFLLGLSAGMRDLAGTGRRARVVVALVCLVLLCAPAIVATSVRNTLFMTASEEAAAVYVAQRVVTTDQVVFAAGLAGGYVRNFATIRIEALNPRSAGRADILGPRDLPAVVIWGPELEIELARVRDLTAADAAAYPTFVAQHYRLLVTFENEQVWAR